MASGFWDQSKISVNVFAPVLKISVKVSAPVLKLIVIICASVLKLLVGGFAVVSKPESVFTLLLAK